MDNIAQTSPLYEYWNSNQDLKKEEERLSKINPEEPASLLFRFEPFKCENLYQTLLKNVIRGDDSSIKGLLVLLSTLSDIEKDKCLNKLEYLLDENLIYKLRNECYKNLISNRNIFTTLKILLIIFLNPYRLEIKNEKKHIYEISGMFFLKLMKLIKH